MGPKCPVFLREQQCSESDVEKDRGGRLHALRESFNAATRSLRIPRLLLWRGLSPSRPGRLLRGLAFPAADQGQSIRGIEGELAN